MSGWFRSTVRIRLVGTLEATKFQFETLARPVERDSLNTLRDRDSLPGRQSLTLAKKPKGYYYCDLAYDCSI